MSDDGPSEDVIRYLKDDTDIAHSLPHPDERWTAKDAPFDEAHMGYLARLGIVHEHGRERVETDGGYFWYATIWQTDRDIFEWVVGTQEYIPNDPAVRTSVDPGELFRDKWRFRCPDGHTCIRRGSRDTHNVSKKWGSDAQLRPFYCESCRRDGRCPYRSYIIDGRVDHESSHPDTTARVWDGELEQYRTGADV